MGGYESGFDLGSELQEVNHFTPSLVFKVDQQEALRKDLLSEVKKGRMVGPLKTPIIDNRWFSNTWVSPYFTIPKLTAEGKIRKWLLIHHLSYHVSGSRALSLNGHIDSDQLPNLFPTPRSAAHLIF